MKLLTTLALAAPLLVVTAVSAQQARPEGNTGAGAAMSGAQSQGMGAQPNAASSAPPQPTQSPGGAAR